MNIGIKGTREITVSDKNTAETVGSGTLRVFATPVMTALIEETAWRSVAPHLKHGQGTVGTRLDISHLSPTPVGMKVRCETELTETDGRRLLFSATVYDETGIIGKGTHERFIVTEDKFCQKAENKLNEIRERE